MTAARVPILPPADDVVVSASDYVSGLGSATRRLLTPEGYAPKTDKGRERGYSTGIMYLAPADLSGYDVCQYRSAGCTAACLNTSGNAGLGFDVTSYHRGSAWSTLNDPQRARIARTRLFFLNRFLFNRLLILEITAHVLRAREHGMIPCIRLNGTSDLPWEKLRMSDGRTILEWFPDVQFYDYTKHPERAIRNALGMHPANYHLTFSRSETNDTDCLRVLAAGGNVAAVLKFCPCKRACKHDVPDGLTLFGRPIVSGDHDDLRFLDPRGVVIGLRAKGLGRSDTSGFVVDVAVGNLSPDRAN